MVNKVILIGRLTKDPELRATTNGTSVCSFGLATNEYRTKDGERTEHTDFHNIVVWGRTAEVCDQYLSKGRQVYIEGSIRTRSYENKDGDKKWITEIHARDVQFLGSKQENSSEEASNEEPFGQEDIPF